MKTRKKRSIFMVRQMYAYMAVFSVLIALFMLLGYRYIVKTSKELAILNQNEFANRALAQVDGFLGELDDVSYRVMTDPTLLNLFNRLQQQPSADNYFDTNVLVNIDTGSRLGTINGPQSKVWRIGVYNQYQDYIRTGAMEDKAIRDRLLATEDVRGEEERLRDLPDKMEIYSLAADRWSNDYTAEYITVKRPLMNIYSQEVYGVVEVQQDAARLRDLMQFGTLRNIDVTVRDAAGSTVLDLPAGPKAPDGNPYEVALTSARYGWSVTLSQPEQRMIAPYQPLLRMMLLGCLLLILLVGMVIAVIARRLSAPLVSLKDTVSGLGLTRGLPQPIAGSESIDEVRELSNAFNAMLGRISDSVALEKKAMLLALQSQMNPHFFHNVMTVISAAGMEGKDDQVVRMCSQVCAMLRYTSSYEEQPITVRDELNHAVTYLELMKARYEKYFTYEIEAEETALALPMPKLVLQPLTENCFEHGFANREPPYFIRITVAGTPAGWIITVTDNGCGMTAEEKAAVLEKIEQCAASLSDNYRNLQIGGLGLVNTALRLRYNSAHPATLALEDNRPQGTTVVIKEVET